MAERPIIVVGVDDSESSHRALRWAVQEAVRRQARLTIITAWTWDAVEGTPLAMIDPEAMHDIAENTQDDAVKEILAEGPTPPEVLREVVQATASEALIEASQGAELIVVGTHGRGPVKSFLLGSVSLSVIRHASCPVVVMPPVSAQPRTQEGAGVQDGAGDP
jgi:nucleotide-binding universal stress UspA family protein